MPIFTLLPIVACGCMHTLSPISAPSSIQANGPMYTFFPIFALSAMKANELTPCFLGILISYRAMSLARLSYALSTLMSVVCNSCSGSKSLFTNTMEDFVS